MSRGNEEGWYEDPYGLHEDRWYSEGEPTKLVRDAGNESYDPVPAGDVPTGDLVPARSDEASSLDDLRRADDPTSGVEPDYSGAGEAGTVTQGFDPSF